MDQKMPTGPVYRPSHEEVKIKQVSEGIRIHLDLPAGPVLIANSVVFAGSGWFLYHTLKGVIKLNKGGDISA
jgi:hypothetical protein